MFYNCAQNVCFAQIKHVPKAALTHSCITKLGKIPKTNEFEEEDYQSHDNSIAIKKASDKDRCLSIMLQATSTKTKVI